METKADVVLIGAGIMSATLGMMLKQLQPGLSIHIYERLGMAGGESSEAWNNAGTGHSAFCELNYTPENKDGSISIHKAVEIAEAFEVSKQFWAFLVEQKFITDPGGFIRSVPHMSFVRGEKNVNFLHKRYEALKSHPLFSSMLYMDDAAKLRAMLSLMIEGRDVSEKVAFTRVEIGTDVNFGKLTYCLLESLRKQAEVSIHYRHSVTDLKRNQAGGWNIEVEDIVGKRKKNVQAKFVFIGAGGRAVSLLEQADIPEGKGYGGFPVSGLWLRCKNPKIIDRHNAKVYGKASVGSPPMSVPHLDTRYVGGKKALLFGPYAGFSTKFLKTGSYLDLFKSIRADNIVPMVAAGLHNIPLTRYLISQVMQSMEDRMDSLRAFYPYASMDDWELATAGMRVQIIKKDEEETGVLEFGTEVVSAEDGSIAALLGASPGASTSVSIILELFKKCFKDKLNSTAWQERLKLMLPTYGIALDQHPDLCHKVRARTHHLLQLQAEEI